MAVRWAVLGVALAGCAVDASGLPRPRDLGTPVADQGIRDLATPGPDLGPTDGATPDLGVDMGPADGGPPTLPFCGPIAGLVGCYTFDGDLPFADESGAANDLVATAVTLGVGAVNRGATLTAGSALYANEAPSLDVSAGFSIDLWANLDVLPAVGRMGLADKNGQFGVFVYPGGRVSCTAGGASAEYTGVSAATWFHVACTHDGSTLRLYVDGRERGTATGPPPGFGTATLNLGEDSPSGGDQLGGGLDEIRVWTRALPPSMVESAAARR